MIGERLEEARKRMGISIREAAEATKIRGDYLISMEDNSFEIDLPQIYIRGFLKNYANFLKLDPTRILTDYDAKLLGSSQPQGSPVHHDPAAKENQESLGRVELPADNEIEQTPSKPEPEPVTYTEAPEIEEPEPELHFNLKEDLAGDRTPRPPTLESASTDEGTDDWNENKALYTKIGIVFAGILMVSIVLVLLVRLLTGGDEAPELNSEVARESAPAPVEPVQPLPDGPIVITSSDNVTLIVEQTEDNARLYSGSLNAGETISLDREGPVSIRFTNGSALSIESNGEVFRPGQSGVGRTVIE